MVDNVIGKMIHILVMLVLLIWIVLRVISEPWTIRRQLLTVVLVLVLIRYLVYYYRKFLYD